jgi:hypothetical protein
MTPSLHSSRAALRHLRALCAACLLATALPAAAEAPPAAASPEQSYERVDLTSLVDKSRTAMPGQKIILRPTTVSFTATLVRLPEPQRADYLTQALQMMRVGEVPEVKERIVLGYGDDRYLTAYIEAATARRLAATAKAGERRRFYALHAYNYSKGPALLVTSFGERE